MLVAACRGRSDRLVAGDDDPEPNERPLGFECADVRRPELLGRVAGEPRAGSTLDVIEPRWLDHRLRLDTREQRGRVPIQPAGEAAAVRYIRVPQRERHARSEARREARRYRRRSESGLLVELIAWRLR